MDLVADYEIVRPLDPTTTTTGQVFLAHPPRRLGLDAEHVALKVVPTGSSEDALRRAIRELRAFATVRSAVLVRLLDAGQDGDRLFYSTEYYPLGSLDSPAAPLPRKGVLGAVADAAQAAHDLHVAGIVHRNIKPRNVLVVQDGGRLSDLGLSQALAPERTATAVVAVPSVEFTDPSVLRGDRATVGSDLWSLGATLHRCLAGTSLYPGSDQRDERGVVSVALSTEPTIAASLPADIAAIIGRCVSATPNRFDSAAQLAAALREIVSG